MAKNKSSSSGCGCIILIVLAIGFVVNKCNESLSNKADKDSRSTYSSATRNNSSIGYTMDDELSDEEKQYLNNSLSTGATPYAAFYGKNYSIMGISLIFSENNQRPVPVIF